MRHGTKALIPILLLVAAIPAMAQQPSEVQPAEAAETAPEVQPAAAGEAEAREGEGSDPAAIEAQALAQGFTKEMVEKLDSKQLYELLKKRDRDRTRLEAIRSGYRGDSEDIIIPLSFFFTGVLIVFVIFFFRSRQNQQRLETIRLMVEKGVEVRPELLTGQSEDKKPQKPLSSALSSIFLGIGIILFFFVFQVGPPGLWGVGFIPLFIGLGKLIAWRYESRDSTEDRA